ncbi:PLC-like phosphodiesterase [Infundibulicybe gibba]|nr:PLC-like phosphodiesterase [Infundibulicybe gibba]
MLSLVTFAILCYSQIQAAFGSPVQLRPRSSPFDLQGHRGGRGDTIENTLPSFAWGIIDGVTTLELDNGITKDGVVVVWHDTFIPAEKCRDTAPVTPGDPEFPYVGKFIANLTLAQIKTLDCSLRQDDFPLQLTYPATKMSTLQEVFDFVECADPERRMLFNIESKFDSANPGTTRSVDDFVNFQHALFAATVYRNSITYQSFEWRTLIGMKALDPKIPTSALLSSSTATSPSPWLAGIVLDNVPGSSLGVKVANAAGLIHANILSPSAPSDVTPVPDPSMPGYITFTTKEMVDRAHQLGMTVKPYTIDRLNIADQLLQWGVDGIITDFPVNMRRYLQQHNIGVSPTHSQDQVLTCLKEHTK